MASAAAKLLESLEEEVTKLRDAVQVLTEAREKMAQNEKESGESADVAKPTEP